ncbi:MAG: site-2 protease family protein [Nitrososphaerales archaeon]
MTETGSASSGQQDTQRIIDAVHQRFAVTGEYLREDGTVEFNIDQNQQETKSSFLSLIDELRRFGFTAALRRVDRGGYLLTVVHKISGPRQKLKRPLILLSATLATILADGFIRAYIYSGSTAPHLGLGEEIMIAVIYGISLLGIIGIHELGHKIASWHHKMDSSWPYFIPGIPGVWPTMGAVISARDPPTNRDSLFDLGLSGPIAGLAVTVVVSIFAVASAVVVPATHYAPNQLGTADYYTSILIGLFKTSSQNYVVTGPTFSLLYFAYSIGFLLTFINLLPAWQLDGGHIANAALNPKIHRILTYASIVVMVLVGFYLMAFLVLFLSGRSPAFEPLDNVSPLSPKRKVFFVLALILAASIFAFVFYNNAFFGIDLIFK